MCGVRGSFRGSQFVDNPGDDRARVEFPLRCLCYVRYTAVMTDTDRQTSIQDDVSAWAAGARTRLVAVLRYAEDNGIPTADVARALGVKSRWVWRMCSGEARHLYVHRVAGIMRRTNVDVRAWINGWPGWDAGAPPPRGGVHLPDDALVANVRANLAHLLRTRGLSTTEVARLVWGNPRHQSTVCRMTSGEYENLDLVRLYGIAKVYNVPLTDLLTTRVTA